MHPYAKAIAAFLIAFTGSLAAGSVDDDHLSAGELWGALAVATAAAGGVYQVPNSRGRVL